MIYRSPTAVGLGHIRFGSIGPKKGMKDRRCKAKENELIPTRLVTGWRVCIDYRKLNEATRKDHFPLPFMDQILERLAGNEFYCFLDGFSGYFQIPIDLKSRRKRLVVALCDTWTTEALEISRLVIEGPTGAHLVPISTLKVFDACFFFAIYMRAPSPDPNLVIRANEANFLNVMKASKRYPSF
ncbi:hypothetical protein Tco_1394232 [Tanacetum coccineum]